MTAEQSNTISIGKAVCIILMLIGHAGPNEYVFNFIYLFHMPFFFFVSGYCFKEKYLDEKKTFVWHRIKGLWWPFVKYNLIFMCFHNFLAYHQFYDNTYNWPDIINRTGQYLLLGKTEQNLGQLWFIRYLLLASLLFLFIHFTTTKLFKSHRETIERSLTLILPLLGALMLAAQQSYFLVILALYFYMLGYCCRSVVGKQLSGFKMGIGAIILIVAACYIDHGMVDITLEQIVPYSIIAPIGIFMVMELSRRLSSTKLLKPLLYIGRHTMPIFIFHHIIYDIMSFLWLRFNNIQFTTLDNVTLHQNHHSLLALTAYVVIGLALSLLIDRLLGCCQRVITENIQRIKKNA